MRKASYSYILSACQKKQRRHVLSFILALAMMISLLPPIAPIVSSEESSVEDQLLTVTNPGVYSTLIGCNAELNFEYWTYIVISDDPAVLMENGQELVAAEVPGSLVLVIEDCHWDEESYALWLKVAAADGYELPAKLQAYPWVFQNYTDVYEEEDWESFSPDALRISGPAYSEPTYIVSDDGVTVSSDNPLFTDLIVTEAEAPTAFYINQAISYNITPKTNEGDYTGHADVTIPIPEGWDSDKVFGFVIEDDGTITALLGTVTKYGTFRFTVPHFSEVGLLEATAVDDVLNKTIVFGKIQSGSDQYVFSIAGAQGTAGRYVSDDGAVQYVINHYTSNDTTTTYVSLTGLDVTAGTEIIVGNTSIVVVVEALTATVDKLLTGGSITNSAELDPLYDVGISGTFDIEYSITSGNEYLTLSGNTITAVDGKTGSATIMAHIKHPTSKNVVGYVTYNVTVSAVNVTSVKNIHVPAGGTATIANVSGSLNTSMLDTSIATVSLENDTLTITGEADEGITYVVVEDAAIVLYAIHINPNATNNTTKYVSIKIETLEHCMVYYAINGGPLYPVTGGSLIIEQNYADGFNVMFFPVPEEGCVTSLISQSIDSGQTSFNQYYSLADGSRYDGSDSDAWPFREQNANYTDEELLKFDGSETGDDGVWDGKHGLRWCMLEGNMNIAQLRDLFSRAIALGADSVTTFTKNNTTADFKVTNMKFIAEKLPTFEKEIIRVVRNGTTIFDENDPYIAGTSDPLEIGDIITYQFTVTFHSKYMGFSDIKVVDNKIGLAALEFDDIVIPDDATVPDAQSKNSTYTLTEDDVNNYVNGQFVNQATLSYSYDSKASSGAVSSVTSASVMCKINSIVTWMDDRGTVWSVQTVTQGSALPKVDYPTEIGYTFAGWDYQAAVNAGYLQESGDFYIINPNSSTSFTIEGTFTPIPYTINYTLDGGTLPDGVAASQTYTIEDLLTLPTPTREGYTFTNWSVDATAGNWTAGTSYAGGYILPHRYGNVTLEAQWTINTYTVTWVAENGTTVLETDYNVPHGTVPHYDGVLPTKEPETRYTFSWSPAITTVTEDVTYIAQFDDALGDNHKVYIGINIAYHQPNSTYNYNDGTGRIDGNSYHAFPAEPHTLHDILLWRAHRSDGAWEIDEYWDNSLGTPSAYIDASIFDDPNFTVNATASGIFDPTGELVKKYFNLSDADYEAIIRTWLSPTFAGPNTDINWNKVSVDDCAIVPYVIKLQDKGNWYIDMVIVVQETSLTIKVEDDQDGNTDHTFLYKITAQNHAGFELVVGIREGETVTIYGLFPGKTYYIEELTGWSYQYGDSPGWTFTKDGDTGASGTGAEATIVLGTTGNEIDFTNTYDGSDWLGGECRNENTFGDV